MVTYIRSDLQFILDQIKLSEAHAAGQPLFGPGGLVPAYNVSVGLRTVDGSFNHLLPGQEKWGAADVPFPTLSTPTYRPADGTPFDPDGPGPAPAIPTSASYAPSNNPASLVFDSSLRTISNLIVDQSLANPAAILTALAGTGGDPGNLGAITAVHLVFKPASNAEYQSRVVNDAARAAANALDDGNPLTPPTPAEQTALNLLATTQAAHQVTVAALEAARVVRDAALVPYGITMDGDNVHLPNVSPDVGLSAPFNSWFTLFGQFFDHGLDLVNKGGSGTVFVPLQPDDPLYVAGSPTNFMVLTRATVSAGADGIMGTADDVRPVNTTTAYVDQNQTYASHASHQVFLREYALNAAGKPVATGHLIEGGNGGMATWAEVKVQSLMLGIQLIDQDVGKVPLLRTDQYGKFIPNASGYAQVVVGLGADGIPNTADDAVISGTPGSPVLLATAIRTNSAFLADIANDAVPRGISDGDITIGLANPGNNPAVYDNELLDAHFMAGDGRVNENIGLTAVHHIFHQEHNRLVEHTKSVVVADAALLLAGGASQAAAVAFLNEWLVVDVAAVPVGLAVNSLVWDGERLFQAAKFGTEMQYQHLVFEEFARKIQPQIDPFIVPDGFDTTINPDIFAEFAHVVYRFGHSMLTETIDRFDPSFNAKHIGLVEGFLNPSAFDANHTVLDGLAAGDIIRGMTRQVGSGIDEFVTSAVRNNLLGLPLDLATINLARGRDTGVPSLNDARREFFAATNSDSRLNPYVSWVDFAGNLKHEASVINFVAAYGTHGTITSETTVEGKRAAAMSIIFGGPGSPADAQDFLNGTGAYTSRLGGLDNVDFWIGGLAEKILPFGGMLGSTFNFVFENQMESLQNADRFYYLQRLDGLHLFGEMENNSFASLIMRNTNATRLPADVFSTPGLILEIDRTKQYNPGLGETAGADGILVDNPLTAVNESADNLGNDPAGGTALRPLVIRNNPATAGPDSNYLRYTGVEHVVLGGTAGNDILIGSEGDDAIWGDGGNDTIEGGAGVDMINGGAGDDIIRDLGGDDNIKAGDGNDVVHSGPGLDLVLAGSGQDFVVLGTDAGSVVFAGVGNDFILGSLTTERILGNEGDDWIEGGTFDGAPGDNFDEIFARDGVRGNDVFFGLGGPDSFIGEGGDDIMVGSAGTGKMDGMSGFDWAIYKNNTFGTNADLLRLAFDAGPIPPQNAALDVYSFVEGLSGSAFNDTLRGSNVTSVTMPLQGFLGSALDAQGIALIAGLQTVVGAGVTFFDRGNIILGGGRSDMIEGRGGDDIIDGDKWLNVRISVRQNLDATGPEIATADSMTQLVTRMFNGTFNPGQLKIVREVLTANGTGDIDTVVFSGARSEYTFGADVLGRFTVAHTGGTQADGTDTISRVERLQFTDQIVILSNTAATGAPAISDTSPTEGQLLTASLGTVADVNGGINLSTVTYRWQHDAGAGFVDIGGATGATFTPTQSQVNTPLRVVMNFSDNFSYDEQVVSAATLVVGDHYIGTAGADVFNGTAGDDYAFGLGAGDRLTGNGGADTLEGGTSGDTLDGGAGDDWLIGGTGADVLIGGAGFDLVAYWNATSGVVVNLALIGLGGEAAGDTYSGIERIFGSAFNDALTGDGQANQLDGWGGNDTLTGAAASDTLDGGMGNDLLIGGLGADVLMGGAGFDAASYLAASSGVVLNLAQGGFTGEATGDVYSGIERVIGSAFNDGLTGDELANQLDGGNGADTLSGEAGNDTLDGGLGADWLIGGQGADILIGGAGFDLAAYWGAAAGVVMDLALGGSTGEAAGDTYSGIERVFGSAFDDALTGDGLGNQLDGWNGNDTLDGRGGNDTLYGGAGADRFNFTGAWGVDQVMDFNAAEGDQIFIQGASFAQLTITPGANTVVAFAGSSMVLSGVASVLASDFLFA